MKSSQDLVAGQIYTRAELKAKFGITDASINNGIFRPKGHESIWLFVTRDKTSDRTQYHDLLEGDTLTMEGQSSSRTDHWLINHAKSGHELLLFYRDSKEQFPGAGFVYEGKFDYRKHLGSQPATFTLNRSDPKNAKTAKPQWQLVFDAVAALGGSATPLQILNHLRGQLPGIGENTVRADLAAMSVNAPARTSYGSNARPRRTDQGHPWDRLFRVGAGPGVQFELYDPLQHGVWEIYPSASATSSSGMSVRRITDPTLKAIQAVAATEEIAGAFNADSVEDARYRVLAAIVRRRGQASFRDALLKAYGGACAITGCTLPAVLEAAHVHPYKGDHTNRVSNGLLLRADIHTLFDLGLIAIESQTLIVRASPELAETEYAVLDGQRLRPTVDASQRVSPAALEWHRSRCGW